MATAVAAMVWSKRCGTLFGMSAVSPLCKQRSLHAHPHQCGSGGAARLWQAVAGRTGVEAGTGLRWMGDPVGTAARARASAPPGPASATAAAPRFVEAERQSRVFCAAMGSPMACGKCARQSSQWAESPWDLARSAADTREKGNPQRRPRREKRGSKRPPAEAAARSQIRPSPR